MSCSIIYKKYSQIKQEKQKKSHYEIFLHYMSKDAVFIFHESSQGIDVHITCEHKLERVFFLLFSKIIFYSIRLISDWSLEQLIRIPFCNFNFIYLKKKKRLMNLDILLIRGYFPVIIKSQYFISQKIKYW
jgi:hypothetical protein